MQPSPSSLFYLDKLVFILACLGGVYSGDFHPELFFEYNQANITLAWRRMTSLKSMFPLGDTNTRCFLQHVIPYTIFEGFSGDQIQLIMKNLEHIQNRTCLQWIDQALVLNKYSHVRRVHFEHKNESIHGELCFQFSYGSREHGFISKIVLGDYCFTEQSVLHLIMHTLGFIHEHQRLDRDCYIEVDEKFIRKREFLIVENDYFEKWPYDRRSITHFHQGPTFGIKDVKQRSQFLYRKRIQDNRKHWNGRPAELSWLDVYKINFRYCGGPDYCVVHKKQCADLDKLEHALRCKLLYENAYHARGVLPASDIHVILGNSTNPNSIVT